MKAGEMLMIKYSKFIVITAACFGLFVFLSAGAGAASLWPEDSAGSIFADRKARYVGDSLTIIINESSKASMSRSAKNSKSGSNTLQAGTGVFDFLASASASGSDNFKASGDNSNVNTVSGKVTVQVVEVKPNGNMVVSGTQTILQNKDEHKITITGVVRSDDVTADNTVLSSLVADAQLRFDGKGPLNAKQRQGILTQIFNIIF